MVARMTVRTQLLTDQMVYEVLPLVTRVLRVGKVQVDADLFVGEDCVLDVVDGLREAAADVVAALLRREERRARQRHRAQLETVPEFLRMLDAGALSLRGP